MVRLSALKLRAKRSLTIHPFIHAPTAKGGASTLAVRARRQTTFATYEWAPRGAHAKSKSPAPPTDDSRDRLSSLSRSATPSE
ncbi:MAG: hypothetical protein C0485_17615 [Pirellula sp.]|nr:hypothetical protein [Pirellula sp.]